MTGEMAGYAMEELLNAGALDVFYTPLYMKKNRPAIKLGVLCKDEDKKILEKEILKQTTTIGIRAYEVERTCMERHFETVVIDGSPVPVKVVVYEDIKKYMPEYEVCKKVAQLTHSSIQEVYNKVTVEMNSK